MDTITETTRLAVDVEDHPLVRAAAAMHPVLRSFQEEIEAGQRIPAALVAQLHEAGFYRMTLPRSLGGLQCDPLVFLRVIERLAEGMGSVGWNMVNNGVIQLVSLGLPDDGVHEIYAGGKGTVIAGTAVQGGGQAVAVDGGYRVTGRWSFGSGCMEASWMLASFQIMDDGVPRRSPDGNSTFWRGIFPRSAATVIDGTWNVTGMRGTGSFDWSVTDAFLPERRTMVHAGAPLDNQWSRWPGLSYALPAQAWLGPHHSSVITGIAQAGLDALIDLAGGKVPRGRTGALLCDNPQVQDAVGRADAILGAGRVYRSTMIANLWNTMAAGGETTLEQRAKTRLAATHAADCARAVMDEMYRAGGSTSFRQGTRLAECWRDLQVVGNTGTIAPEWYPLGGKVLLGIDPGGRMR